MSAWWDSLDMIVKVFYFIAIPASVILIIQVILSFIGMNLGGDGSMDMDFDADAADADISAEDGFDGGADSSSLRIFSARGFVAFFTVMGWTGVALASGGVNKAVTIFVSVILGFLTMLLIAWIFQQAMKLQSNGTIQIKNAIGAVGEVYLPIPAKSEGIGKVSVVVQERYSEFDAMTEEDETLKTGTPVRVVDIRGGNILIVEKNS